MEIKMNLGEKLEEGDEEEKRFIQREEVLKLQPFLRRRKFRLILQRGCGRGGYRLLQNNVI